MLPSLIYASRMSAKVDSAALQDGFATLSSHFLFHQKRLLGVVQQGMNTELLQARRYHWHSDILHLRPGLSEPDFVEEPEAAICSDVRVKPLNLVAKESGQTRDLSVDLIKENFYSTLTDLKKINQKNDLIKMSRKIKMEPLAFMSLPSDKDQPPAVLFFDYKRVEKVLFEVRDKNPQDFEGLLAKTSAGPKTLRALALVSEIIYGAKPSYQDPVRYSFAHGGKDGYPYPVDRENYERSINILEKAVNKARIGEPEKIKIFRKLAIK